MAATDKHEFGGGGRKNWKIEFGQFFLQFQHDIPSNIGGVEVLLIDGCCYMNDEKKLNIYKF